MLPRALPILFTAHFRLIMEGYDVVVIGSFYGQRKCFGGECK